MCEYVSDCKRKKERKTGGGVKCINGRSVDDLPDGENEKNRSKDEKNKKKKRRRKERGRRRLEETFLL